MSIFHHSINEALEHINKVADLEIEEESKQQKEIEKAIEIITSHIKTNKTDLDQDVHQFNNLIGMVNHYLKALNDTQSHLEKITKTKSKNKIDHLSEARIQAIYAKEVADSIVRQCEVIVGLMEAEEEETE